MPRANAPQSAVEARRGVVRPEVDSGAAPRIYRAILPYRPTSEKDGPNARRHYMARARRAVWWRRMVADYLSYDDWPRSLPDNGRGWTITLRVCQRRGPLCDLDNLQGSLKSCRDGIAQYLHVTDAQDGPIWRYEVERGPDCTELELRRDG